MISLNNEIRFETTTRCNYNCVVCCREKLTRKLETMSLDTFKVLLDKIIKETSQYAFCAFSGFGEPFLDTTITEKVEYARKKGLDVLILTNASMLSVERFKQFQKLGVSSVRVSFYGTDAGSYAKAHGIRGSNIFKIIRNNLLEISKIRKNTKFLLTLNVVSGINDGAVAKWIDFWKDKTDLLEVWRPHNWVDGRNYRKIQDEKLKTCGRPFKGPLQVQVDGTVNMCCFDFDGKLTIGDLKTQSLKEIFSSSLYRKIVECHESGDFKGSNLICENCDQRNRDKSEVMIYNSRFNIDERVKMLSTTYKKIMQH